MTPGTAFILPSAFIFLAGPPIRPMSPACTWPHELGQPVQWMRTARGTWLGLGLGLGLGLVARAAAARAAAARAAAAWCGARHLDARLEDLSDVLRVVLGLDHRQAAELRAGAADDVAGDLARVDREAVGRVERGLGAEGGEVRLLLGLGLGLG